MMELKMYVLDQDPDSPAEWALQMGTFEAIPEGLVSLAVVQMDGDGAPIDDEGRGPALWVHVDELRARLDQLDAMMRAHSGADTEPSAPGLKAVE